MPRKLKHCEYQDLLRRRKILKGVVFERIIEIRTKKKKPTLATFLQVIRDSEGEFSQEFLREKFTKVFQKHPQSSAETFKIDFKFERLSSDFARLLHT